MPVYHFTIRAYGSWQEDDPEGYVQRGEGRRDPSPELARWRDVAAVQDEVQWSSSEQRVVICRTMELIAERSIRCHAYASTPTHQHWLVSFRSPACTCERAPYCAPDCPAHKTIEELATKIKQLGGHDLAKQSGIAGKKWFSRGWGITPVKGVPHFTHLLTEYFPKHVNENGIFWRER